MKIPKGQITSDTKRFFQLMALAFLFIVLDVVGILSPLKGVVDEVISPIKGALYEHVVAIGNIYDLVVNFSRVQAASGTVSILERDDEILRITLRRVTAENEALRKQLDAPLPASYQFIPAEVLGISRYMQVWGGAKDGVSLGMAVVDGSVYIGKIISVTDHTSSIILADDPDSSIPAVTSRGTRGRVVGEYGEKILLNTILQKDYLFLGDTVTTSGEEGYPPNLLIGKVVNIQAQDYQVYKQAELAVPLIYGKETTVFIVKGT